jgi:hypothetical protein
MRSRMPFARGPIDASIVQAQWRGERPSIARREPSREGMARPSAARGV